MGREGKEKGKGKGKETGKGRSGPDGVLSSPKNSFRFSAAISAVHLRWPGKYFTFTLSPGCGYGVRERGRELANALQKVCHKHKAPKDADNGIKHRQAWAGGGGAWLSCH